jgi:iron-sulfur cluster assembly accessory protein
MTGTISTEPIIAVTSRAAEEIKTMMTLPENAGKSLRVYVEQGGCSGMQYGMVFDEKRDGDLTAEKFGVSIFTDPISAQYLRGTVIDFSEDLTAGGFKIINPNARESCGCGKSFSA